MLRKRNINGNDGREENEWKTGERIEKGVDSEEVEE